MIWWWYRWYRSDIQLIFTLSCFIFPPHIRKIAKTPSVLKLQTRWRSLWRTGTGSRTPTQLRAIHTIHTTFSGNAAFKLIYSMHSTTTGNATADNADMIKIYIRLPIKVITIVLKMSKHINNSSYYIVWIFQTTAVTFKYIYFKNFIFIVSIRIFSLIGKFFINKQLLDSSIKFDIKNDCLVSFGYVWVGF